MKQLWNLSQVINPFLYLLIPVILDDILIFERLSAVRFMTLAQAGTLYVYINFQLEQ